MPQGYQDFSPVDVALSCVSWAPLASGHERLLLGDIVAARPPGKWIGTEEQHRHLWLQVIGYDIAHLRYLAIENTEGLDPYFETRDVPVYEKRRFAIPLTDLQVEYPLLDIARCIDLADDYQPFCVIQSDGQITWVVQPFDAEGLIWDRATGTYLADEDLPNLVTPRPMPPG